MTNPRDVIISLKKVREEKGNLSYTKILSLMEQNGDYVSISTLSRVFADGSEDPENAKKFRYEDTLRPIAKALLDIETIESDDDVDTQAFKSLLKLKMAVIDENAKQIKELKESAKEAVSKEKAKYLKRLEEETAKFQKSIDFAKKQIELKDKRIDQLLDANQKLLDQMLKCHKCKYGDTVDEH